MTLSEARKVLDEGWFLGRRAKARDYADARAVVTAHNLATTPAASVAPVPAGSPMGLLPVLFADEDEDITLGIAATMLDYGQQLADELGRVITARDPVTDTVWATFEPAL